MIRNHGRKPLRIGVGGFLHETNTFAPSTASFRAFEEGGGWPGLCRGDELITQTRGVNVGIAGFVEDAEARGWILVPTLWCAASPSGLVERDAFETIAGEIVDGLTRAAPLDGIYLDLHGAMVTEHLHDGEGELLHRVRRAVGPGIPIVASLDLHANVTPRMVEEADMLIAFRTYPHVDMAETGRRAASALAEMIESGGRPAKAFRQIPFLIPIVWQRTEAEPCREIYAELARMEASGVSSLSFAPGFPAADFPDCRPSVLTYAVQQEEAEAAADELAGLVAARESLFNGKLLEPDTAVHIARERGTSGRPIILADAQDNPGAGSNSDTTGMLRALLRVGVDRAAIGLFVDPDAAKAAHRSGIGSTLRIALGGRSGIPDDAPLEADYFVEQLSDGRFRTCGPYYGHGLMDLGPCACLRLGGIRIVVSSRKAQMADQAMFRFIGIEPRDQAILVVKSSVHFRADFEPIASEILICTAPGSMPMDPSLLPWTSLAEGVRLRPNGPSFSRSEHGKIEGS
ncbi:M81 family metallopeptidase [Microvirga massiliensis]|uniref:M81 family metallopeptidase n=1 Tax=Microvirga massiliensis TaxID=1033741 RepID=UPI00062B6C40|nr:M81 family metallopeptidase [Microvirga massiliensis]